ncbi:MAG: GGDEF domain-containing response regulator [Acidiferrobacterales bacterium]
MQSPRDNPSDADTRPHILLVEDSQTAKAVLAKNLAENYRLIEAKDGEEAWQLLVANTQIEVVITDINMPRMNGQQLLVKIRKSPDKRIANVPVIVMTAADDNTHKNLAFQNGANDFLTKPIDPTELRARVNVHYKLTRTIRELEESRRALAEQASTDPLTRLHNRRVFYEQGTRYLAGAKRHQNVLSVLVLDIDHFKLVNDQHGHRAGDEVLVRVAAVLSGIVRNGDIVARVGGEEFAILLPETNRLGAAVLAERIRAYLEQEQIDVAGKRVPVTASIGVATFEAEQVDSFDELLSIADKRLYLAKNAGRNRICVNDEGKSSFV